MVSGEYDETEKTFSLTVKQSCLPTPQQEKICANAIGVDRHTAPYVAVRAKLGLDDPSLRQRGPTRRWVESDRDRHD